ncbi:uncharacterized protein K444DRAFT_233109 [Hyaloscypha bicolor E]|uniref:Uncharacterized protein n=1 Tax=Hyaloscypha bicolor E TaxID=1095630 RepID=A0A2J6SL29_9HELO|nr:uncharacterized protein K444DRAFT_233109 [Hyaloscypha bicolor E]PMD51478.1 hypothetical protein K444DRAFT_233109 [Hyaloscypha bicolor E]
MIYRPGFSPACLENASSHHHRVLLWGYGVKCFLSALSEFPNAGRDEAKPNRLQFPRAIRVRTELRTSRDHASILPIIWWYYCFLWLEPSWVFLCASRSIFHAPVLPGNSLCINGNRNSYRPQPREQRRTK